MHSTFRFVGQEHSTYIKENPRDLPTLTVDNCPIKEPSMGLTWTIPMQQALVGLLGITNALIAFQLNQAQVELARDRYMVSKEMGKDRGEIRDNKN
jgi:hypothetical protein